MLMLMLMLMRRCWHLVDTHTHNTLSALLPLPLCHAFPATGHVIDHQASLFAHCHQALQQPQLWLHSYCLLSCSCCHRLFPLLLLLPCYSSVDCSLSAAALYYCKLERQLAMPAQPERDPDPTCTGVNNFWKVISLATAAVRTLFRFALHLPLLFASPRASSIQFVLVRNKYCLLRSCYCIVWPKLFVMSFHWIRWHSSRPERQQSENMAGTCFDKY